MIITAAQIMKRAGAEEVPARPVPVLLTDDLTDTVTIVLGCMGKEDNRT